MDDNLKLMLKNVSATIRRMKAEGTVSCSLDCLRQNTPTKGLMCSQSTYLKAFNEAALRMSRQLKFPVYSEGVNHA